MTAAQMNDTWPHWKSFVRSLQAQQAMIEPFARQRKELQIVTLGSLKTDTPFFSALIEQCIYSRTISKSELYSLHVAIPPYWKLHALEHFVSFSSEQITSLAQSASWVHSPLDEIIAIAQIKTVHDYFSALKFIATLEDEPHELLEHPETELLVPGTRERIITYAPAISLLEKLRAAHISLHDLEWRQFEELVADLLSQDGYEVQLGPGTKDGGKDIIAVKRIPGAGHFMAIWQAKKLKPGKPVGIDIIRELADTRSEYKASKGVIVTTTSLTKGALARIERDCYLLHKVDGNDLDMWIRTGRQP